MAGGGKLAVDDPKVMDVARPGKGKLVSTSRPVVAPIVSTKEEPKADVIISDEPTNDSSVATDSAGRKVITPLSGLAETETAESGSLTSDSPVIESIEPSKNSPGDASSEPLAVAEEAIPPLDTAVKETGLVDDSASVDAIAAQAEAKNKAKKQAEEDAKQDALIQELTDSKKYFVPISSRTIPTSKYQVSWVFILVILVIASIAAVFILADAGIVELPFELPFDFIK